MGSVLDWCLHLLLGGFCFRSASAFIRSVLFWIVVTTSIRGVLFWSGAYKKLVGGF